MPNKEKRQIVYIQTSPTDHLHRSTTALYPSHYLNPINTIVQLLGGSKLRRGALEHPGRTHHVLFQCRAMMYLTTGEDPPDISLRKLTNPPAKGSSNQVILIHKIYTWSNDPVGLVLTIITILTNTYKQK